VKNLIDAEQRKNNDDCEKLFEIEIANLVNKNHF
jgi:hypothetical protein